MTRQIFRSATRRGSPFRIAHSGLATALAVVSLAAATVAAGPRPASAHGPMMCAEREAILEHLERRFDESRVAVALDTRGRMVEILAAENGSWTLLITTPDGRSCLAGSGSAFTIMPAAEDEQGPLT